MAKRETKLTLADIQQNADELNKKQKFHIDKDQGKFIYYYPKFSKRKVTILINDLASTIDYVQQNNLDFFKNDHELQHYVLFLVIKHFTDLKTELKDKPIESHFATMNNLVEIGWYDLFLTEMFTMQEISKVLEEISKRLNLSMQFLELEKELINKIESTDKDKLIKEPSLSNR
ncbi:hypothetical protein [Lysinibacillus sphaericus]|uniref:Uncharacterized protein n=1 Tax=Lysinibacillus sphaericus OT4b.31 TaxID=1285586 RepID=R7ZFM6_LYSSH|nr:hypothetical protein [Lysinibacillus sphaericus]EON72841.1 hypothetical protein H131_09038 [Lysinibacillus sphaericus OT4b.31]